MMTTSPAEDRRPNYAVFFTPFEGGGQLRPGRHIEPIGKSPLGLCKFEGAA